MSLVTSRVLEGSGNAMVLTNYQEPYEHVGIGGRASIAALHGVSVPPVPGEGVSQR